MPVASRSHPAWFGAVLSTAVMSILAHQEGLLLKQPWLNTAAIALLLIATAVAFMLAPRYVPNLLRPKQARADLGEPNAGALLATIPAGILLLASAWGTVGPSVIPAAAALATNAVLAVIGALLALWVGMMWNTSVGRDIEGLKGVNGSWLLPPVGTMLVALALAPLVPAYRGIADVLLLVGYAFLGAGLIMFLIIMALFVARLILAPNLPGTAAPTMWVPLGPAGILGIAAIRITESAVAVDAVSKSALILAAAVAAMSIGFGLWWALFAALDLVRMRRHEHIHFQPGWWAFVFPPSALLLSLVGIQQLFPSDRLSWASVVAFIGLMGLWLYVAFRSVRTFFQAPSSR